MTMLNSLINCRKIIVIFITLSLWCGAFAGNPVAGAASYPDRSFLCSLIDTLAKSGSPTHEHSPGGADNPCDFERDIIGVADEKAERRRGAAGVHGAEISLLSSNDPLTMAPGLYQRYYFQEEKTFTPPFLLNLSFIC